MSCPEIEFAAASNTQGRDIQAKEIAAHMRNQPADLHLSLRGLSSAYNIHSRACAPRRPPAKTIATCDESRHCWLWRHVRKGDSRNTPREVQILIGLGVTITTLSGPAALSAVSGRLPKPSCPDPAGPPLRFAPVSPQGRPQSPEL